MRASGVFRPRSRAAGCRIAPCISHDPRGPARPRIRSSIVPILWLATILGIAPPFITASLAVPLVVYDDQLQNQFEDWSWAEHDLSQSTIVHSGLHAISMIPTSWQGLYFHRPGGVGVEENGTLELWVHGGTAGNQQIRFFLYSGNQSIANADLERFVEGGMIPAGRWARATIPFSDLGVTGGAIDGIAFQADAAQAQPTVYFDDLVLLDTSGPPRRIQVTVDPNADRRAISPLIYGVNFGSSSEFASAPYPLRRWGGNSTTRYNWRKDAANRASDWFFLNLPESDADSTNLPNGSTADLWIDETLRDEAEAIVTVPTIGWAARDRVKRWGFSVAKYGPQQENECTATGWPSWCEADAGNGIRLDGTYVTGNDPHDTSIEIGPTFVSDWLRHILGRVGDAATGGVAFYALDNEPMLWNSTHRDVHPAPATLDELWSRTQSYAEAIKATDPTAKVLGPAAWGWCEYFYSALDGCQPGSDMAAHEGLPLIEWYLEKNHQREEQTGVRPVDYLDVHYYPQAPGVALSDDESPGVAQLRLRSLKSLYDPSYVDESWIDTPVRLIPRMKEWIAARSPGVKLAITEYNWGGDEGLSSALAQAEALAIFGREGVDLATRWVAPQSPSRVLDAFRLYLDYDGEGGDLRGESVRAVSSSVDDVGSYAIRLSDTELGLLLFNKTTSSRTAEVGVTGAGSGTGRLYRFDGSMSLGPAGEVAVTNGSYSIDLPALSATLVLMPLDTSAVSPTESASPERWLRAQPTPFRSTMRLSYLLSEAEATPGGTLVLIRICDASGRVVRRLSPAAGQVVGWNALVWDGRDDRGRPVASGAYFLSAGIGSRKGTVKVVKVE